MGVGSGLGGSAGFGLETVYGTYAPATSFPEVHSSKLEPKPNFAQRQGLAAGRFLDPTDGYVMTHREAGGPIELEALSKGFGKWLAHFTGSTSAPVIQGAGPAYLQTHVMLNDNKGKSFSWQQKAPNLADTVLPLTFTGCKATSMDFSCGVGDPLLVTMDVDAQDYTNATALAAPSYPVGLRPFNWADLTVKVGTYGAEASVSGVRKVALKLARKQKLDQQYAGAAGKKSEPTANGNVEITGSIETDFVNTADFYDRGISGAATSLIFEWVGPLINATFYQTLRWTLPGAIILPSGFTLDGPDVVAPTWQFKVGTDGVNTVKAEYTSTDVTVL